MTQDQVKIDYPSGNMPSERQTQILVIFRRYSLQEALGNIPGLYLFLGKGAGGTGREATLEHAAFVLRDHPAWIPGINLDPQKVRLWPKVSLMWSTTQVENPPSDGFKNCLDYLCKITCSTNKKLRGAQEDMTLSRTFKLTPLTRTDGIQS